MKALSEEQIASYNKRAEIVYKELKCDDSEFPMESTTLERCILYMRKRGASYGGIQSRLGMIPKDVIRETLKKYNASLIDLDTNRHKIPDRLHKLGAGDWNWEDFKNGRI